MTSLYRLDARARAIAATFGAEAGDDPWDGDYVAPARPAPVIVSDGRGGSRRYLRPKLWGVPPPPRGREPVTHVRNLESPFWIGTLRHAELRCLIPATAFACWSGPEGARRPQKYQSFRTQHTGLPETPTSVPPARAARHAAKPRNLVKTR